MDLSKLRHGFVKIEAWISICFYIVLSKLMHEFLYIVSLICQINTWIFLCFYMVLSKLMYGFLLVATWICQNCYMYLLKLLHIWLNESKYSMYWFRCASNNISFVCHEEQHLWNTKSRSNEAWSALKNLWQGCGQLDENLDTATCRKKTEQTKLHQHNHRHHHHRNHDHQHH